MKHRMDSFHRKTNPNLKHLQNDSTSAAEARLGFENTSPKHSRICSDGKRTGARALIILFGISLFFFYSC
jgi:hypothetical protein